MQRATINGDVKVVMHIGHTICLLQSVIKRLLELLKAISETCAGTEAGC